MSWEASAAAIRHQSIDSVVISLVNNPVRRSILSVCSPRAVLLGNRFRNRRIAVNAARQKRFCASRVTFYRLISLAIRSRRAYTRIWRSMPRDTRPEIIHFPTIESRGEHSLFAQAISRYTGSYQCAATTAYYVFKRVGGRGGGGEEVRRVAHYRRAEDNRANVGAGSRVVEL